MRNELLKAVETAPSSGNRAPLGHDDEIGLHHDHLVWLEALEILAAFGDRAGQAYAKSR